MVSFLRYANIQVKNREIQFDSIYENYDVNFDIDAIIEKGKRILQLNR